MKNNDTKINLTTEKQELTQEDSQPLLYNGQLFRRNKSRLIKATFSLLGVVILSSIFFFWKNNLSLSNKILFNDNAGSSSETTKPKDSKDDNKESEEIFELKNEILMASSQHGRYKELPLWTYNVSDGKKTQLTPPIKIFYSELYDDVRSISQSPDRKFIALVANNSHQCDNSLIILSTLDYRVIANINVSCWPAAYWSPDSQKLVFLDGAEFWTMDVNDKNTKQLITDDTNKPKKLVDWSPDSNKFTYLVESPDDTSSDDIWIYDFSKQNSIKVDSPTGTVNSPLWLNNTQIIYSAGYYGLRSFSIESLEERQIKKLWISSNYKIFLSPDRKKILYVDADRDNAQKSTWISNIDGTETKQLFDFPISDIYWSPDGKQILYITNWSYWTNNSDNSGIWISDNLGNNMKQILKGESLNGSLSDVVWSPGSLEFAYSINGYLGKMEEIPLPEKVGTWIYNLEDDVQYQISEIGPPLFWY